jgi:hypothetical protein
MLKGIKPSSGLGRGKNNQQRLHLMVVNIGRLTGGVFNGGRGLIVNGVK